MLTAQMEVYMKNKKFTLFSLLFEQKKLFFLALFMIFVSEGAIHLFQIVKGEIIELAVSGSSIGLQKELGKFVILIILIPLSFYLYSKVFLKIRALCAKSIRKGIFESIIKRPYSQYIQNDEGRYLNAYTSQISLLESSFFQGVYGFLQIVATSIPGLIFIYLIYPPLLLVSLVGMILSIIIPKLLEKKVVELEKKAIMAEEENLYLLNEFLNGIETIINFAKELLFIGRFKLSTKQYNEQRKKWFSTMAGGFHIAQLVLNVYSIVSLFIIATVVNDGILGIGNYIAVLGIMFNFTDNLPYTSHYLQGFKVAKENLKYINDTMAYQEEQIAKDSINIQRVEDIFFNNITFSYPGSDKKILKDFSLRISKRGITQIQGESGKGKSTLLSLLAGYYAPNKGEILLSGTGLPKIANLNELVTIMRQDSIFFDGSLADNLTMFRSMPDEKLISGLKSLGLDNLAKNEVLHAKIRDYSGGEARRLMLLRALLRESEVVILDEPLANLDRESIERLEKVLMKKENRFLLLITHQPVNIATKLTVNI